MSDNQKICNLKNEMLESASKLRLDIEIKIDNLTKLMSKSATERIMSKVEIERLLSELKDEHRDCRRRIVNLKMRA
jgi:hypothetical protein